MNSGHIAERVHEALKARLAQRLYRPGERLDPAILATELASSVTPIREAMHLLAGRGLLETAVGVGFFVPRWDEPGLQDLYRWNRDVVLLTLRNWPRDAPPAGGEFAAVDHDPAIMVAEIFAAIARRSDNAEHGKAVDLLNDRLAAIRQAETRVMGEISDDLAAMSNALNRRDANALRRQVTDFHGKRVRRAAAIVRAYYRT